MGNRNSSHRRPPRPPAVVDSASISAIRNENNLSQALNLPSQFGNITPSHLITASSEGTSSTGMWSLQSAESASRSPSDYSRFANEFTITGILGVGGFGIVYKAISAEDGEEHAVKRISVEQTKKEMERAMREVKAMNCLTHPGIVRLKESWIEEVNKSWQHMFDEEVYDRFPIETHPVQQRSGKIATYLYIKMELGRCSLADRLAKLDQSSRDIPAMMEWFKEILSALASVHAAGFMHRDLKPSNILFAMNGRIMLCDLGVANYMTCDKHGTEITRSYTNIGNDWYRAPEQGTVQSKYNSKVDVFALGLILAELCEYLGEDEEKKQIFDNFRSGNAINILPGHSYTAQLIGWLTRAKPSERPTCKAIQDHLSFESTSDSDTMTLEEHLSTVMKIEPTVSSPERDWCVLPDSSRFAKEFTVNAIRGKGAFGCVFEVTNIFDDYKYALKRIPVKQRSVDLALQEVRAMARLDHSHIIRYNNAWVETYPSGWDKHQANFELLKRLGGPQDEWFSANHAYLFIQMQLCTKSLSDWLAANTDQSSRSRTLMKTWFYHMVSAVAYIHEQGLMHRDLKPSNILLTDQNMLKICDLGIVTDRRVYMGVESENQAISYHTSDYETDDHSISILTCCDDNITWTAFGGTPLYMSPEQSSLLQYNSKTDVFSLGLIFTEICIVLTNAERAEIFDNYRRGIQCDRIEDPAVAEFIAQLTQVYVKKRPSSRELLDNVFIMPANRF